MPTQTSFATVIILIRISKGSIRFSTRPTCSFFLCFLLLLFLWTLLLFCLLLLFYLLLLKHFYHILYILIYIHLFIQISSHTHTFYYLLLCFPLHTNSIASCTMKTPFWTSSCICLLWGTRQSSLQLFSSLKCNIFSLFDHPLLVIQICSHYKINSFFSSHSCV